ncbi:hypothetical protein [Parafilimonas sp.]|uniref:hypothetical protein n=1 Tax=Parafilimonas sp. TaxID=1969739 RepID=UPI0039E30100
MHNGTTYNSRLPLWKQRLLQAREKYMLANYAGCRDFGVPFPPNYTDQTTNGLTRCITDWLKFNGHYSNRVNCQGQVRLETIQLANGGSYKKASWTRSTTNRGTADLHCIVNGKPVSIEIKCKATRDRLRPEQLKEKQRIESAGGLYMVAGNMEQFTQWYDEILSTHKQDLHNAKSTEKL